MLGWLHEGPIVAVTPSGNPKCAENTGLSNIPAGEAADRAVKYSPGPIGGLGIPIEMMNVNFQPLGGGWARPPAQASRQNKTFRARRSPLPPIASPQIGFLSQKRLPVWFRHLQISSACVPPGSPRSPKPPPARRDVVEYGVSGSR